jgi:hypothetical protein
MNLPKDDLSQTKLAAAYLVASLVQTLSESEPTFQDRFSETLGRAYGTLRDEGGTVAGLELLAWTREILKIKIS